MNEVIRQLMERKSIRVFEDKPISQEDKRLILEAAFQAPTAGNQQFYTIHHYHYTRVYDFGLLILFSCFFSIKKAV